MARRALLIGSAPDEILGIDNDLVAVAAMLAARGFTVRSLHGPAASRDGILTAYEGLIADTEPGCDDPAVIYYAGHGGLVHNTDEPGEQPLPRTFQCLIPTDYDQGSEADFRGISELELSLLQAQLTEKTRNVTAIFDCCHAARMSRGPAHASVPPRGRAAPTRHGMARHMRSLRERYPRSSALDRPVTGNPHAVRIVASGVLDPAWPMQDRDRTWYGALTLVLLRVLDEVGDAAVSWKTIIAAVRGRIRQAFPDQRPDAEGPVNRRVFSLEEVGEVSIPLRPGPAGFTLGAGLLGGVTVGDLYAAVALDAPDHELARLQVTHATPLSAEATVVAWQPGVTALPPGAIAMARELAVPRMPVRVEAAEPEAELIGHAIARTRRLRLATRSDVAAIATLALSGAGLALHDAEGPLRAPLAFPAELPDALAVAGQLAAALQLLELEGEHGVARRELDAEWGIVDRGQLMRQPEQAARLEASDPIYVRVGNAGSRNLFAHVFNVGMAGEIVLLSHADPAGIPLRPGDHAVLGETTYRDHVGLPLYWPPGVPREQPRLDMLLIIVTTTATDLRVLESANPRAMARGDRSPLQQALGQLHDGTARSAAPTAAEHYLMVRFTFLLQPPA